MNTFTIYKTSTGEILYSTTTSTPIDQVGLQTGEGIIEGSYSSNEFVITDGSAVARTDNILEILRLKRDALLAESDWTQMSDSPLSDSKKTEWATYRQTLRDIPSAQSPVTDIDNIIWPSKPS